MKQTTLNFCIAALLAAPLARAEPRNISAEIAALRPSIVSAKVYHIADSLSFRSQRDEEFILRGCSIPASGDGLAALLDLLSAAELHEAPPNRNGFEVRTAIYLARGDGSTVPLLLNLHFPGSASNGSYERTVPVEASAAFSTALHAWMTPRTAFYPPTGAPCTDTLHINN